MKLKPGGEKKNRMKKQPDKIIQTIALVVSIVALIVVYTRG